MLVNNILKLALFYVFTGFLWSCSTDEQAIKPEVSALTESVYASVTIRPADMYNVHTVVTGIIDSVLVEEGDLVNYGDPLIQISNVDPEINLRNAKLALDLAQQAYDGRANRLNELKDEIKIARLRFKNDSLNFAKQKNLWSENIGSKNEYEARELAFHTSKSNLNMLLNRFHRTEQDLGIQLQQSRNQYKHAQNTKGDHLIESKIKGKVYALFKEQGEMVNQQEPVAMIGAADSFVIEMLIDEVDIAKVNLGQLVIITLDAYPEQIFEADITKVYPKKNEATQTFTAEATFRAQPERLFPGLSGEANIVIKKKEMTLVIPRSYLMEGNQVKTENGLVNVQTGLRDLERVEILSGIDSTTNLYLPEP